MRRGLAPQCVLEESPSRRLRTATTVWAKERTRRRVLHPSVEYVPGHVPFHDPGVIFFVRALVEFPHVVAADLLLKADAGPHLAAGFFRFSGRDVLKTASVPQTPGGSPPTRVSAAANRQRRLLSTRWQRTRSLPRRTGTVPRPRSSSRSTVFW